MAGASCSHERYAFLRGSVSPCRSCPFSKIAAYGSQEAANSIKYSGTEVPLSKEHPPILQEIQLELEDRLHTKFNHCMLNRYEDGSVHIGSHSDNLGKTSTSELG